MSAEPIISARPFLGRSSTAAFQALEQKRHEINDLLGAGLKQRNIDGLVIQSSPSSTECWVKVECWMPSSQCTENALRASIRIVLESKEMHRFPIEMRIEFQRQGYAKTVPNVVDFNQVHADRCLDFLTKPNVRIQKLQFNRCQGPQSSTIERLSLPRNRVVGLKYRFIAVWRVHWVVWAVIGVVACMVAPMFAETPGVLIALGLALAAISGILRLVYPIVHQRRGQRPMCEPRQLLRFDSWQTVVTDLGSTADILREAILHDLRTGSHPDVAIETERVWHWGLDDKVEREQIVVRFRRALVFVEIHGYGDDLYVDWEAFLNFGVWVEKTIATGFESKTGLLSIVNGVQPGWQKFGEYDLSDMNFALEWTHAVVRRQLKLLMAERKIDQEIDFRIIREERGQVKEAKPDSTGGQVRSRLKRMA
jgi:hypothetical protein